MHRPTDPSPAYWQGFPCRLFLASQLSGPHEQSRTASRKEQRFALFFVAWITHLSHGKFFMGFRRAKSTQGNTNCQKIFCRWSSPGSPPVGLKDSFSLAERLGLPALGPQAFFCLTKTHKNKSMQHHTLWHGTTTFQVSGFQKAHFRPKRYEYALGIKDDWPAWKASQYATLGAGLC